MPSFSRGKIQNPLAPQAPPPDPGTTSSRTATQDLRAYPGSCLRILLTPGKKLRVTIMTFNLDLLPQPDPSDVGENVEVLWVFDRDSVKEVVFKQQKQGNTEETVNRPYSRA